MLKVKFTRIKNVVVAEILEQGNEIKRGEFRISDGTYFICSLAEPHLNDYTLYIRGNYPQFDEFVCAYSYDTIIEAKEAIAAFKALIEKHNSSYSKEDFVFVDETEIIIAE